SVFVVFAIVWHDPWAHIVCWAGALVMLVTWLVSLKNEGGERKYWSQTLILIIGMAMMLWINYYGYLDAVIDDKTGNVTYSTIAWPWFIPIGSAVAFIFGYLLARKRPSVTATTSTDLQ
ncbi:MAG: hypothetical protein JSV03_11530, partial [Planctomycetota bacterium]